MITGYVYADGRIKAVSASAARPPVDAIWIDMLNPTAEEVAAIEAMLQIDVPTPEEMREIEVSSRLYSEDGADFMTLTLPHGKHQTGVAHFAPVTFILVSKKLITLRYSEPKSFEIYASKLCREPVVADMALASVAEVEAGISPARRTRTPRSEEIMLGLLEAVVDRVADLLEGTAVDLDAAAKEIFNASENRTPTPTARYKEMLRHIGRCADLASRTREGLATFDRLLPFAQLVFDRRKAPKELKTRIKAMARDIQSLNDFAAFLNNKTSFLLDTTVGMISIEQNAIIKIFSVAAVGFMPPTLIASIYGMNFTDMPELTWSFGYPAAILGMFISAILPLAFFRYKRWL
ncbi:magnesium transporter CorA family protein [Aureimonas fodinaquatilis]|uniref:Magnesium transport protein CorA n=1 Tax=Aureimonas fodinaquatilis TaxID=2565783 RepID=A0A5B0DZU0_9HYPH|nr:magnesium transporter CorA family protein [Aureimonas fodinaquatilis]KAA0972297.1 magnesium transporter CorA family protein [Aureimonas fodinaquatilis]